MRAAIAAGLALGAASRVEEVTDGFDLGISTNFTWLAVAFGAGALAGELAWSGLAGAAALTAANGGYYAWIALTEPGTPLDAVAGPVDRWFALGVTGGFVFGAAGALLASRSRARRAAACLPLAALLAAERVPALAPLLP
jgi:hypothetical protein